MTVYARIADGRVMELITHSELHPSIFEMHQLVDISSLPQLPGQNWVAELIDGQWKFSEPVPLPRPPRQKTVEQRLDELEARFDALEAKLK